MRNWNWNVSHWSKLAGILFFFIFIIGGSVIAFDHDTVSSETPIPVVETTTPKIPSPAKSTQAPTQKIVGPEVLEANFWADSVFNSLSLDQKIGQLFMISAYSNMGIAESNRIKKLIENYHLGGLIFFQGSPVKQANLTNQYQALSKTPLLIGIDGEWGLGMRLDSTISFPRQITLGAIFDNSLIYQMGYEIGRQCKRLGIHVNFAPAADINSNPLNPVIGSRSFGESPENVAKKSAAYMRGLQHQHIIATGKHFPGHGNTETDSHHTLPVVHRTKAQLNSIELVPFKQMIKDSLIGMLSGHLNVPSLDSNSNYGASLSNKILVDLLRKELGFKGIVFTDALNMKGVLKSGTSAEVNLRALLAGNDILLSAESVAESVQLIKTALKNGRIKEEYLNEKVMRILNAKYFAGLHNYAPIDTKNLIKDLNSEHAQNLHEQLLEASVSLITNKNNIVPLKNSSANTALISIEGGSKSSFVQTVTRFNPLPVYTINPTKASIEELNTIVRSVDKHKTVIIGLHNVSYNFKKNYNIHHTTIKLINDLKKNNKEVILSVFGGPYALSILPEVEATIMANTDDRMSQITAAQTLYGSIASTGSLTVTSGNYKVGSQAKSEKIGGLSYGTPESVGVNGEILQRIDFVAEEGIRQNAFPGCQVLIAHKNKVIFNKSYGTLSTSSKEKVTDETLYDLASITKVAATLQAAMLLYDQKKLDLNQKIGFYLPELKGTDKEVITVRDLLLHRSGMVSFYPTLWENTFVNKRELSPEYYNHSPTDSFSMQVAPHLFTKPALKDSVWKWVIASPPNRKGSSGGKPNYLYSDLGFLTLQKVIERITKETLDQFVTKNFYQPLGIKSLTYTPLLTQASSSIAPTEQDNRFRGELLKGTVHDQMAAILGGVSGHAGLFGSVYDLAPLFQMNLSKGKYAGKTYIKPETIELFTKYQTQNPQRGLGWDKPRASATNTYYSEIASADSYGHTGFTGNVVWMDPAKDLLFIFLSNRVNPIAENNKINTLKTRKRIHDIAYEAILRPIDYN